MMYSVIHSVKCHILVSKCCDVQLALSTVSPLIQAKLWDQMLCDLQHCPQCHILAGQISLNWEKTCDLQRCPECHILLGLHPDITVMVDRVLKKVPSGGLT